MLYKQRLFSGVRSKINFVCLRFRCALEWEVQQGACRVSRERLWVFARNENARWGENPLRLSIASASEIINHMTGRRVGEEIKWIYWPQLRGNETRTFVYKSAPHRVGSTTFSPTNPRSHPFAFPSKRPNTQESPKRFFLFSDRKRPFSAQHKHFEDIFSKLTWIDIGKS